MIGDVVAASRSFNNIIPANMLSNFISLSLDWHFPIKLALVETKALFEETQTMSTEIEEKN